MALDPIHLPAWITLAVGIAVTPIIRWISNRRGWVEKPGVRRLHETTVARTGGLAILIAVVAGLAVGTRTTGPLSIPLLALLLATSAVFLVGWVDDVRGAGARSKLLVQLGAALSLCAIGVRIESIPLPGGSGLELGWFAWPATVLWLAAASNALNLIDGTDGLAAGLAIVGSALVALVGFATGDVETGWVASVVTAGTGAFLFYNAHPARLHLGDGGSLALGFLLGGFAVVPCGEPNPPFAAFAAPALALAIPIVDTALCVVRRRLVGRSVVAPDTAHVHHHLLGRGLSPRLVVAVVTATAATVGLLGATTIWREDRLGVSLILAAIVLVVFFAAVAHVRIGPLLPIHRRRRAIDRRRRDLRKQLEHLQLIRWDADGFDAWWTVVERAAQALGVDEVSVASDGDGEHDRRGWSRGGVAARDVLTARFSLEPPVSPRPLTIECSLAARGPLETASERLSCFVRLLEEPKPDWAKRPKPAPARLRSITPGSTAEPDF